MLLLIALFISVLELVEESHEVELSNTENCKNFSFNSFVLITPDLTEGENITVLKVPSECFTLKFNFNNFEWNVQKKIIYLNYEKAVQFLNNKDIKFLSDDGSIETDEGYTTIFNFGVTKIDSCAENLETVTVSIETLEEQFLFWNLPMVKNESCESKCKQVFKGGELFFLNDRLQVKSKDNLDRETTTTNPLKFIVDCQSIKFNFIIQLLDINDNAPVLQRPKAVETPVIYIDLQNQDIIHRGFFFELSELFIDEDLPSSNNYFLTFPAIDFLRVTDQRVLYWKPDFTD